LGGELRRDERAVSTFTTSHSPAAPLATFSSSGAIMRHGPHHGAQKSTTTGSEDEAINASKIAASGTSSGSPVAGSAVWQ